VSVRRGDAACAVGGGLADAATGAVLVAAPLPALALLRISPLPSEPVYLRWIGAFVLAVGASYLYPFALRDGGEARRRARLAVVFETTALARGAVALVAGGALAAGALDPSWLGVPLFDAAVAGIQLEWLRRGGLRDA
jgi:hypothetical protein